MKKIIAIFLYFSLFFYFNAKSKSESFGRNDNKQLGLGDTADDLGGGPNEMGSNLAFVNPRTIDNAKFKSVACGGYFTCSIFTNDKAKC